MSKQDLRVRSDDSDSIAESSGSSVNRSQVPPRARSQTELGCCLVERTTGRLISSDGRFQHWTRAELGFAQLELIADLLTESEYSLPWLDQPQASLLAEVSGPSCAGLTVLLELVELSGDESECTLVRFFSEPTSAEEPSEDALTGLPDRKVLAADIAQKCLRDPFEPFALLFLDIDQFKPINDKLGHRAGDQVLFELAQRWHEALRADDLVCRYGGDEFVAILSGVSEQAQVSRVVSRLEKVTMEPIKLEGESYSFTVSIGSALSPNPNFTLGDLIHLADQEMYLCKQQRLPR